MLPTRRAFLCSPAVLVAGMMAARAQTSFRFALTPVFLDNDAAVLSALQAALEYGLANAVELVQRRTYQEITGALLDGSVDAAWTCGYPFLQHRQSLTVMGVPVWRGEPRYQSYLIAADDDPATDLAGLAGGVHAFSDPDSNSGFLVTASDLARMGQTPETYFSRSIFTYGHRNVVRAVAGGLARSGSVDGYVWETLAEAEPDLTVRTRVVTRSEWLGFPPFVARTDRMSEPGIAACLGGAPQHVGRDLVGGADSAPDRPAPDGVEAGPERQQQQRQGAVGRGPVALRRFDERGEDEVLPIRIAGCAVQIAGRELPKAELHESPRFFFRGDGFAAETEIGPSGDFVVTAGSRARVRTTRTIPRGTVTLRNTLVEKGVLREEGDFLVFTSAYSFTSASAAAAAVIGASANGRILWKLPDGRNYADWEASQGMSDCASE